MSGPHGLGLLAGYAADAVLGDPPRWHPVAGFGWLAQRAERLLYRDHWAAGLGYAGGLVSAAGVLGAGAHRLAARSPAPASLTAAITAGFAWAALGGRSLAREAGAVARALEAGDVAAARTRLRSLCARDPARLDPTELARATVESVAENTSDAVVAPLLWGAIAGPAGIAGYRAVNTLDAMVGYRTTRYHRFGWAAARLDDAANWLPARVSAALACAMAPMVAGSPRRARECWRRYGAAHPSPNAGQVEAAFAGALHRRLGGGDNRYGDHTERRPVLGDGPDPTAADIHRAIRLATAVGVAAALLAGAAAAAVPATGCGRGRR